MSAPPPYPGGPPPFRRDGRHRQAPPPAPSYPAPVPQTDTRPYGRMVIFTLLDDKVGDFDRLAEQTAEQVRIGEPDTFVYVIHTVPGAPLQRIFYEIYRNRAAFDVHEDRPYTRHFSTERRSYVLATNVIELRLKYAKVAPLPQPAPPPPARGAVAQSSGQHGLAPYGSAPQGPARQYPVPQAPMPQGPVRPGAPAQASAQRGSAPQGPGPRGQVPRPQAVRGQQGSGEQTYGQRPPVPAPPRQLHGEAGHAVRS